MSEWHLLSPAGEPPRGAIESAARSGDLRGKIVGLLWNGKPGGELLLDEVGRNLTERFPDVGLVRLWETRPSTVTAYGMSEEDLRLAADSADLIIGANAD